MPALDIFSKNSVRGVIYLPIKSACVTLATGSQEGNHSETSGLEGGGELWKNDLINLGKIMLIHFSSVEYT